MGEFGHDAGGLYRESYSVYCSELQSSFLPLLVKSPNNRNTYGANREAWMPNPAATSSTHLDMFTFLGTVPLLLLECQCVFGNVTRLALCACPMCCGRSSLQAS